MKRLVVLIVLVLSGTALPQERRVTVASKMFTESRVLAEIMAQLIEARTDIVVERKHSLGGSLIVFKALEEGSIDLYPEYTGTGWAVVLKRKEKAPGPLETFLMVKRGFEELHGATLLDPYGFNNTYVLAVRPETAEEFNLKNVSDLAGLEDRLRFGWSTEFLNRNDGWPGLRKTYGFKDVGVRGMEHGLAYQAIGSGNVDVIDAYSTDGKLLKYKLSFLKDDRSFFPPYQGTTAMRLETLERFPELKSLLSELSFRIPDKRMQQLNYQVEEEGKAFEDVARSFLIEEKLIGKDTKARTAVAIGGDTLSSFLVARIPITLRLLGEHLLLTGVAVLLGIAFAVPLGIWLTRNESFSGFVMGTAGVIQTIPSLALLAFMIPITFLGLSMRSAIVALFLYSILPIVRNTYTGIKEVDPDLVEAGEGMGLTSNQLLRRVQLPLALPTIMAGIRTATVISIGVATLAAFIGAGGLGEPIITGLQLNSPRLIMAGAIPAALLALLADWGLGAVENRLLTN